MRKLRPTTSQISNLALPMLPDSAHGLEEGGPHVLIYTQRPGMVAAGLGRAGIILSSLKLGPDPLGLSLLCP